MRRSPLAPSAYADRFGERFIHEFLQPRLEQAYRLLAPHGSLYFHIDYREVHYCKILLDQIFGRECFLNEIIWAYDYGGKAKTKWPAKHDNILYYVKDPGRYVFNTADIDREPYMAPGLVGPEKPPAASCPPTPGGIPSLAPTAKSAPATRPRSRWGDQPHRATLHPHPGTNSAGFLRRQRHSGRKLFEA
jgi:site-specific DNA-methyltransferase (adenine-specific)